eukprot:2099540-Karenia_brevis.AAC.1
MSRDESPDPRAKRENLLSAAAERIRSKPTLPADPHCPSNPWHLAEEESLAVQLPLCPCAFH